MTRTTATRLRSRSMVALVASPAGFRRPAAVTNPAGPLIEIHASDRRLPGRPCRRAPRARSTVARTRGHAEPSSPPPAGASCHDLRPQRSRWQPHHRLHSHKVKPPCRALAQATTPTVVTTVADVGAAARRITQSRLIRRRRAVLRHPDQGPRVGGASSQEAILYHAGDCKLEGSDAGYGAYDAGTGGVFCSVSAGNSPRGRALGFIPRSTGSHYVGGRITAPSGTASTAAISRTRATAGPSKTTGPA